MARWDPELYLKFQAERTRPAWDLSLRAKSLLEAQKGRIETDPLTILDLGCGPGNSTAVLAQCFPKARITGLDSSAEMIQQAEKTGLEVRWIHGDAGVWEPEESFDLVFSNAVLQWFVDFRSIVDRMGSWLGAGGVLAVQMPANGNQSLHLGLKSVAASPDWSEFFREFDDPLHYREPEEIRAALEGMDNKDIWETTYWHTLRSPEELVEWYAGTGMAPWLERLPDDDTRQTFRKAVQAAVLPHYQPRLDGTVPFPFRRVFYTAVKYDAGQRP